MGRWSIVVLVVAFGFAGALQAGEQTIVVQDHIKITWSNELVTYPLEAPEGQCHRDSVRVDGPKGPVACQLSEVQFWPGSKTFVKSAKLSFIVDLKPLARDTYRVRYSARPSIGKMPTTDLSIKKGGDSVEVTTSRFGAKLLLGRKRYARPASPSKVPGPIAAMQFGDGKWLDGSRMYGRTKITGYSSELVASGPVFAEVVTRYTYEGGNTLTVTAHVAAGDSSILIDAHAETDDRAGGWQMAISDPSRPVVWRVCTDRKGTNRWPGMPKYDKTDTWIDVPLADAPAGDVTSLAPWSDWWNDSTQVDIHLRRPGEKRELRISRRDAGAWVTPAPTGKFAASGEAGRKRIPLVRDKSGMLYLRIDNAKGWRKWAVGTLPPLKPIPEEIRKQSRPHRRPLPGDTPIPTTEYPGQMYLARYEVLRHGRVGRHLNEVKDWVLDWEVKTGHPHLYVNKEQLLAVQRRGADPKLVAKLMKNAGTQKVMRSNYQAGRAIGAYLLTGNNELARKTNLVAMLDDLLGQLAVMDTWRMNGYMSSYYDAIMSGDLLSPEQRKLFQARFAYLCYRSADPGAWSMERGYCSGNLNMSVANNTLLGIAASTIPDHPMAKQWIGGALVMVDEMLAKKVGPAGEWPESVAHYANVSATPLLLFAIVAKNAGLKDFVNDERMKRLQMWLAKQYTPPDPRHTEGAKKGKWALLPPIGRGPAGEAFGLHGAMARATVDSDPEYSKVLQWVWMRGQPRTVSGNHLLGWEQVCMDPGLPAKAPDWGLEFFPQTGVLMRYGFDTPNAWYAYLVAENHYTVPTESGTMPILFAKGVPISARGCNSYPDREELLLSRVLLARELDDLDYRAKNYAHNAKRKISGFSELPRQQYVAGDYTIGKPWRRLDFPKPPMADSVSNWRLLPQWPKVAQEGTPGVNWRRQVLFPHAKDPAGVGYLVLRDTVAGTGGGGTMWQFWTVSDKIGTPEQAADRKRFLADAPGKKRLDARKLPQSDRYTAVGPFGLDVEFYIASPADTPRHTLRHGTTQMMSSNAGFSEYQDLLHLQRPDDGAYVVVIYPRKVAEEIPTFKTLAGGKVVQITGRFGTDLCFLSDKHAAATAGEALFEGTAASVLDRESGLVLSLAAEGRVRYKQYGIASDAAAGLRVGKTGLTVDLPSGHKGATVSIVAPGSWERAAPADGVKLKQPADGVTLKSAPGGLQLTAPEGVGSVRLVRG